MLLSDLVLAKEITEISAYISHIHGIKCSSQSPHIFQLIKENRSIQVQESPIPAVFLVYPKLGFLVIAQVHYMPIKNV